MSSAGRLAQRSFASISAFLRRHAPGNDPVAFADAWRRHYAPEIEEVRLGRRL
jgi:hypothetical protein